MTSNNQDTSRINVAKLSLGIGVFLLFVKFGAYEMTGSHAILSDALESVVNVLSALIALIVITIASRPADKDHPYGHGKAEYFSMAFEGGFISFAAILIFYESISSTLKGFEIQNIDKGVWLTLIAGIINGLLGVYLKIKGKKLHSNALVGGGEHLISDFITSIAVIIGLLLVKLTGQKWIDPLTAVLFGSYLFWTGFKLVKKSLSDLMDAEDHSVIKKLSKLFTKNIFPGIIRIHHTRVMRSGRYHHIDAHVVVPEFWEIKRAHDETNRFENTILKEYGNEGEFHFHLDPCRKAYCEVCDLKDCPIRARPFLQRISFSIDELIDPEEPVEYRRKN